MTFGKDAKAHIAIADALATDDAQALIDVALQTGWDGDPAPIPIPIQYYSAGVVRGCIEFGAPACLTLWAWANNWTPEDWIRLTKEQGGHLAAAACGQLSVMRLMHAQGVPWDSGAKNAAAQNRQMECLKFLHENGCPWHALAYDCAVNGGSQECIDYVRKHGSY